MSGNFRRRSQIIPERIKILGKHKTALSTTIPLTLTIKLGELFCTKYKAHTANVYQAKFNSATKKQRLANPHHNGDASPNNF